MTTISFQFLYNFIYSFLCMQIKIFFVFFSFTKIKHCQGIYEHYRIIIIPLALYWKWLTKHKKQTLPGMFYKKYLIFNIFIFWGWYIFLLDQFWFLEVVCPDLEDFIHVVLYIHNDRFQLFGLLLEDTPWHSSLEV